MAGRIEWLDRQTLWPKTALYGIHGATTVAMLVMLVISVLLLLA
jgi:competence protein ComGC